MKSFLEQNFFLKDLLISIHPIFSPFVCRPRSPTSNDEHAVIRPRSITILSTFFTSRVLVNYRQIVWCSRTNAPGRRVASECSRGLSTGVSKQRTVSNEASKRGPDPVIKRQEERGRYGPPAKDIRVNVLTAIDYPRFYIRSAEPLCLIHVAEKKWRNGYCGPDSRWNYFTGP